MGNSTPLIDLQIEDGDIWLSFDEQLVGSYRLIATSNDGTIKAEVYQDDFETLAGTSGTAVESVAFDFEGTVDSQYLRISGTGNDFEIQIFPIPSISVSPELIVTANVFFSSSSWASEFVGQFNAEGLGYSVPAGTVSQFDPLPWIGMDKLSVRFSRSVPTLEASQLSLRGSNGKEYASTDFTDFSHNLATNTATWTIAESFGTDKLVVDLSGMVDYIDLNGLDRPDSQLRVNVAPNDVNQNAGSNLFDTFQIRRRIGTSVGDAGYSALHDLDGNGEINRADQILSYSYIFGHNLPQAEPSDSQQSQAADATVASIGVIDVGEIVSQRHEQLQARRERTVDNAPLADAVDVVFGNPQQALSASRRTVRSLLRTRHAIRTTRVLSADQLDNVIGTLDGLGSTD